MYSPGALGCCSVCSTAPQRQVHLSTPRPDLSLQLFVPVALSFEFFTQCVPRSCGTCATSGSQRRRCTATRRGCWGCRGAPRTPPSCCPPARTTGEGAWAEVGELQITEKNRLLRVPRLLPCSAWVHHTTALPVAPLHCVSIHNADAGTCMTWTLLESRKQPLLAPAVPSRLLSFVLLKWLHGVLAQFLLNSLHGMRRR